MQRAKAGDCQKESLYKEKRYLEESFWRPFRSSEPVPRTPAVPEGDRIYFYFLPGVVRLAFEGMQFGTCFCFVSVQTDKILFICVLMWKTRQKSDDLKFCKTHTHAGSVFCASAVWPHVTRKWLNAKGRHGFFLHLIPLPL